LQGDLVGIFDKNFIAGIFTTAFADVKFNLLLYKNRIETRKSFAKIQADRFLLSISMWLCPLH